jgi:hypothetical protein
VQHWKVLGVELANGDLLVIHSMPLRDTKLGHEYQEAKQWQS